MDRIKFAIFLGVYIWLLCDERNIPIVPIMRKYQSDMWYDLSSFAGKRGLKAEHKYYQSIDQMRCW